MFRNIENGKTISFEKYEGLTFDYVSIIRILKKYRLIGFNSKRYDILLLLLALRGANNDVLKTATDDIIKRDMTPWGFEDNYDIKIPNIDHIDIIEVAPGMGSLKIYGGRLHSAKLQDLPIDPEALISPEQREELKLYCANDLQTTIDLYRSLIPQIELREHMSLVYRDDLRSKSDAQIAEAVIRSEFKKKGLPVTKPNLPKKYKFKYTPPNYIAFSRPELLDALRTILEADFCLNDKGVVEMPESLKNLEVRIGDGVYRMGIGGLHSSETTTSVKSEDIIIEDRDVASYYPNIILNNNYYPKHLDKAFLEIYNKICKDRLSSKHRASVIRERISEIESLLDEK